MAKLLRYRKYTTKEGDVIERKIWVVPRGKVFSQGIKYALVFIHNNKRIIWYDNEKSKGPHKHYCNKVEPYAFVSGEQLFEDFEQDVKKLLEVLYSNQKN